MKMFILITILLVVVFLNVAMIIVLVKNRKARNLLPDDDEIPDEVLEVNYNGNKIPVERQDKVWWDSLSRNEKRSYTRKVNDMVNTGKWVMIDCPDGIQRPVTIEEFNRVNKIK